MHPRDAHPPEPGKKVTAGNLVGKFYVLLEKGHGNDILKKTGPC